MKPDPARLLAAIMVSCLLHAAVALVPYAGASRSAYQPARGGKKPEPSRPLNATLVAVEQRSFPAAELASDAQSLTHSPAESPPADSPGERMLDEEPRPAQDRTLGSDLFPLPAPRYYSTDQLTKRPQPIGAADLDTPEIRPILASGTIILKLWISSLGIVSSVDVEKSDLPEHFLKVAVEAFAQLRFVPGELNGQPVGTMMRIEVTYDDGRRPPP